MSFLTDLSRNTDVVAPSLWAISCRVIRLDFISSADNPVNTPVSSTPISYMASPWPSLSRHFNYNRYYKQKKEKKPLNYSNTSESPQWYSVGTRKTNTNTPKNNFSHTCVTRCSKRNFDGLISFNLYSTLPIWGSGGNRVASSFSSFVGHTSQLAGGLVPGSKRSKNESIVSRSRRWFHCRLKIISIAADDEFIGVDNVPWLVVVAMQSALLHTRARAQNSRTAVTAKDSVCVCDKHVPDFYL